MKFFLIKLFQAVSCILFVAPQIAHSSGSDLELFFSEETMVETVSRHPKPLWKTAENISVVTSAQIERMNGHTLYEVLNRVVGVNVISQGADFGAQANLHIHGILPADFSRALVLLDNVRLNTTANGVAVLNSIPLGIIERIEIIKGPASSTWGSSMGGVVNIITKKTRAPKAFVDADFSMSYGEADTRDLRGEFDFAGLGGNHYLFLGNQYSEGQHNNRHFKNSQVYGKSTFTPFSSTEITFTGGYFMPEWKGFELSIIDRTPTYDDPKTFFTASVDHTFNKDVSLHFGVGGIRTAFTLDYNTLGVVGGMPENYFRERWYEWNFSANSRLVYHKGIHTLVLGAELQSDSFNYSLRYGPAGVAAFGPGNDFAVDTIRAEQFGLFLHDTISLGKLTVTPGFRYDSYELGEDVFSPSLGLVYHINRDTRLRASISRGFNAPFLSALVESSPVSVPNPDLGPERIWSYQVGMETRALPYLYLKSTLFYHEIEDIWRVVPSGSKRTTINQGDSQRYGIELEAETVPVKNISFAATYSYLKDEPEQAEEYDTYKMTLKGQYSSSRFHAELFGTYYHFTEMIMLDGRDDSFIWDLNMNMPLSLGGCDGNLFMTVHNLTNESQYWGWPYPNPGRWVEVGLRFSL